MMRGRLSSEQLGAIRASISIAEIAERGGVVFDQRRTRASMGDYWALCPFHGERSPSFHVSERRGFFRCFGCGAKGDAIALAQKLFGMRFREAVQI